VAILDRLFNFTPLAAGQDIGAVAVGTADSTDIVNYGAAVDWSQGRPLFLHVRIADEAVVGTTSTVSWELQDSADGASFAAITPMQIKTIAIPEATLVKGYQIMKVALPVGIRQYLKLVITVAVNNLSAGMYHGWIGLE
jgi:hypothetical protein